MSGRSLAKLLSVVCAAAVTVAAAGAKPSVEVARVTAESVSDLQAKYNELEKKQQKLKDDMQNTQADIAKQEQKQDALEDKISVTRDQIAILNTQITETNADIAEKEKKITQKQQEIKETYELYKQRMRAAYMASDPTMLGIILGAEDMSDFIMRAEMVQRVSEHDAKLVEKLKRAKAELQATKKELEAEKKQLQGSKDKLNAKQSDLNEAYRKSKSAAVTLEKEYEYYKANKAAIEKQMAIADADIQAALAAAQSGSSGSKYTGGKLLWPTPGYYTKTSGYGWRSWPDGSSEFHKGFDISGGGIYGAKIVAAAGGKVLRAYDNGNGYGIHVLIDHGGGLATLYGHMSGTAVSVGQTVKRGQTIGYVGSTGWSTGPHLHFEVRKNGYHTNPGAYLG